MTTLAQQTCTPCKGGIPPLSRAAAQSLLAEVPEWQLNEDATRITRRYRCRNFMQAQALAIAVGTLSEDVFHHPDISYGWGYCEVLFFSHKIKGLHKTDFIMAARSDQAWESIQAEDQD